MIDKKKIFSLLEKYKYLIVIVCGILIVTLFDDNSVYKQILYKSEISGLEEDKEKYEVLYKTDSVKLRELSMHPEVISKIAREKYFMKRDNEDIFVLSDDEQQQEIEENNETTQ